MSNSATGNKTAMGNQHLPLLIWETITNAQKEQTTTKSNSLLIICYFGKEKGTGTFTNET